MADKLTTKIPPPRLAHVDLIPSTYISHVTAGCFSSPASTTSNNRDRNEFAIVSGGDTLELVRLVNNQSWKVIHKEPLFGTIRCMSCLPVGNNSTNTSQLDCLVITSDSGALTILKYNAKEHRFDIEAEDFFGRSGMRRTVPGQYLAVEPRRGRAIMTAALESSKLLFPIHRQLDTATGNEKVILLSAIEVNRPASFTFALVALDSMAGTSTLSADGGGGAVVAQTAISGPCRFASLESEKGLGMRQVIIYEYDSALQNCAAVLSIPIVASAPPSSLIPIPAVSSVSPLGGLFVVCSPGDEQLHALIFHYDNNNSNNSSNNNNNSSMFSYTQLDTVIPRRVELAPEDSPLFITGIYTQVTKGSEVFTLIQNELGDLYRVVLSKTNNAATAASSQQQNLQQQPHNFAVRYFDTLPRQNVAQCAVLLITGVLLVFGENGTNGAYNVKRLGPNDDSYLAKSFRVRTIITNSNNNIQQTIVREVKQFVANNPGQLNNLDPLIGLCNASSAPTLQMKLFPNSAFTSLMTTTTTTTNSKNTNNQNGGGLLQFQTKKFITVRGKGYENSSVSLIQYGHRADVVAEFALPVSFDNAIMLDRTNHFLLTSSTSPFVTRNSGSSNTTLVFSADKFEVPQSTEFVLAHATIAAVELPENGGIIQVHQGGIRHISLIPNTIITGKGINNNNNSNNNRYESHDWAHHSGRRIQHAAANSAGQLMLSFEGGLGLMLFDYDRQSGRMSTVAMTDQTTGVSCLAIAQPPPPRVTTTTTTTGAGAPPQQQQQQQKALLGFVGHYNKEFYFVWLVPGGGAGTNNNRQPQLPLQQASKTLSCGDAAPTSCSFVYMGIANKLFAVIGLENGTVWRLPIDPVTGAIPQSSLDDPHFVECGSGPVRLIPSPKDKSCFAISSGNVWRLSVQDRETYTQVPVSVNHGAYAAAASSSNNTDSNNNNDLSARHDNIFLCPLFNNKLPNGVLVLTPALSRFCAATIDVSSSFNETVLMKPSRGSATTDSNNVCALLQSVTPKMARRVLLSRDGSVGVVLENEVRTRASIVHSLARENHVGRIRVRLLNEDGGSNNRNNNNKNSIDEDDDDFAPTAKNNNNTSVNTTMTTSTLKQCLNTKSLHDCVFSTWSIETFSTQVGLLSPSSSSSAITDSKSAQNTSNRDRFDPVHQSQQQQQNGASSVFSSSASNTNNSNNDGLSLLLNESATAIIVGKIRFSDASTSANNSERGSGSSEQIVVAASNAANPRHSLLYAFSFNYSGTLTLLHKTVVDDTATALLIMPVSRWLVVASGKSIGFYSSGREQLLRKHLVHAAVPNKISTMCCSDEEILCVADCHESIFLFKVTTITTQNNNNNNNNNNLQQPERPIAVLFADDFIPRHVTCCTFVDPSTIAVGDRFGSVCILRFNFEALAYANTLATAVATNRSADEASSSFLTSTEGKLLKGAPKKLDEVARFFVGQTVVSLDRDYQVPMTSRQDLKAVSSAAAAAAGAGAITTTQEPTLAETLVLYYATATGKIGAFVPISDDDFQHLSRVERVLRDPASSSFQPLLGRDHCSYRSSFGPVVNVCDIGFVEHAWRTKGKDRVEGVIEALVEEAKARAESVKMPTIGGARPLEAGLSEIYARAIGNVN